MVFGWGFELMGSKSSKRRRDLPKKKATSGDYHLLADDIEISFSNDIFTLNELKKCIENKTPIKFTYKTHDVIQMFPNKLSDNFFSSSLSAYTIDDNGKKKWRRFRVDLMKKV